MHSLTGQWQNNYGSNIYLTYDENSKLISGTYHSETGATGTYYFVGYCSPISAKPDAASAQHFGLGQNIGWSLFWRPINADPQDYNSSWHWVTTQVGQYFVNKQGEECLYLIQSLLATSAFPGIASKGNYPEAITFKRISHSFDRTDNPNLANLTSPVLANAINQNWHCPALSADMLLSALDTDDKYGWIKGKLILTNEDVALIGFTDIHKLDNSEQALCLTGYSTKRAQIIAINGVMDSTNSKLTCSVWLGNATPFSHRYVQVSLENWHFENE
ncbi:hypothetical protein HR060_05065 [Catenovulum sp. SM1970]|uniref:avidin/streptavidin family protein n=1 Tax=Marinifaba aquimaris TaxID=2741323 RepID=UPI00157406F7|nr:avidin/streptavidin family protein [Marinifaba aquimaris]NTS76232.1 hypothetical protein [Marinifaba aquimaris]